MQKRGLVIFDVDGTLFKGADATIAAVHKAFSEIGLASPHHLEIASFIGRPVDDLHAWLRSRCSEQQAPRLIEAVDQYELDFVSDGAQLYPGITAALENIRGFVAQMAICTNGPQNYVERVLATHDLRRFFDRIRHRQSAADTKALMVRELLAQLDGRPAVVVGDRQDDIDAAHQNGLKAIAATYGYGSHEELRLADAAAISASDVPTLVAFLIA
jgi:phosphoglycolate phosphatase